MLVVPETIVESIQEFAKRITGHQPIRIQVKPRSDAGFLACGQNVARAIEEAGGQALKGWRVWWIPGVLIEAQAHVVWKSEDGIILDVTPNSDNETECVFIPDSMMSEQPGVDCVPSKFMNLSEKPFVDRYIECAGIKAKWLDQLFTSGRQIPPPPEVMELQSLTVRLRDLVKNGDA